MLVPYGEDLHSVLAARIVERCKAQLPDLTGATILLPDLQIAPTLRRELLRQVEQAGHKAMLGPRVSTLNAWVSAQADIRLPSLSPGSRELLLVEELQQFPKLFGDADPWQLAASLLELFDQLIAQGADIPPDPVTFTRRIGKAYGVRPDLEPHELPALSLEAELVHTLWTAWRQQIAAEGKDDPAAAYVRTLRHADLVAPDEYIWFIGFDRLSPAEIRLVSTLCATGRAELLLYGECDADGVVRDPVVANLLERLALSWQQYESTKRPSDKHPCGAALDQAFAWRETHVAERARAFAQRQADNPFAGRIQLLSADDSESHAQGIDLQVRTWLLDGKCSIGIVTDDRRLARRVRALLERAGVLLQDRGGWPLSTSSAAAALERWLQTVEQDFARQPLTDVLKSPFVFPRKDREHHLTTVYRLERDIIHHENVPSGLERYRRHIDDRLQRLSAGPASGWGRRAEELHGLLDDLEHAAEPLLALVDGAARCPLDYLEALTASLHRLGMAECLRLDAAGQRVLQELAAMRASLDGRSLTMDWPTWRSWLGRTLETHNFRPSVAPGPVELLSLDQARLARFDAMIIAALDRDHVPGQSAHSPFFNDGVRHELGLETWDDILALRFHRFRRLLEAAPSVLLTVQRERDAEPILPSPWLAALRTFSKLAWGCDLPRATVTDLIDNPAARIKTDDDFPYPEPTTRPAPQLPAAMFPATVSAGAHQRLIDCPYQFFGVDGLRLRPPEEIRQALIKSDYGERVHLCLEAFHNDVDELPGPFRGALDDSKRAAACELLVTISNAVFKEDLADNFLHRGWLQRWLELIPDYIDWQIERNEYWRTTAGESQLERELAPGLQLKGRIDRIDSADGKHAIVDYKTGAAADQELVEAGESVQLTSYAALLDNVERAEFLLIGADQDVRTGACLEADALRAIIGATNARLTDLKAQIGNGAPMPAWGDARVCEYCKLDVVCRRHAWQDASTPGQCEKHDSE